MTAVSDCDPWIRYRETGLFVVPSIHCRVLFAQLVVRACLRRRFATIAVELPASSPRALIDQIRTMAPATGMLIQPVGEPVSVRLAEQDSQTALVEARRGLVLPITPADSIVTALRCPQILAEHWPGWNPDIMAIDAEHEPGSRSHGRGRIMDDYDVVRRGLPAFSNTWKSVWQTVREDPVDARRERTMAHRLRKFIAEGRDVLFVCGAAHWPAIAALLDDPRIDAQETTESVDGHTRPEPFRLVAVEPSLAWLWGWLDDMPRVVWDFETACRRGEAERWDKRAASEAVLAAALAEARKAGLAVSARKLLLMTRYQHALMCAAGRWTPELDDHVVHSAHVSVNRPFADVVKRAALDYPAPQTSRGIATQFARTTDDALVLRVGDDTFLCEPADGVVGSGRRLPLIQKATLTKTERESLDTTAWVYRDWPGEQLLHNQLIARARLLGHRATPETTARRFTGDLGLGIAWRRTIRSRSSGSRDLYVRHHKADRRPRPRCDDRCPVVWIFDPEARISDTFAGFVPREGHSSAPLCHSAFYWLKSARRLGDTPLQQFAVAYCVSLMRGLMPTGQRRTREAVHALVESFPVARRATVLPWHDDSLQHLSGCDLAIASAVKYAGDHVIVVTLPSYPLSPAVEAFAQGRGVKLIRLSRDAFEPSALERLSLDHNTPAPEHWQAPFAWCERFIPPVEDLSV